MKRILIILLTLATTAYGAENTRKATKPLKLKAQQSRAAGETNGKAKLGWDANKETDLAGYTIHYGTQPGNYTKEQKVPDKTLTSAEVSGLVFGQKYYFALKAYNTAGVSSIGFSNEINVEIKALAPAAPTGLQGQQVLVQLGNISTRGFVQGGDKVLIGGFIITGEGNKRVMVRGMGPSLPLTPQLPDPTLAIYDSSGQRIAENDNWNDAEEKPGESMKPGSEKEAAFVKELPAGAYTVILSDARGQSGYGMVEIYGLKPKA